MLEQTLFFQIFTIIVVAIIVFPKSLSFFGNLLGFLAKGLGKLLEVIFKALFKILEEVLKLFAVFISKAFQLIVSFFKWLTSLF